MAYDDLKLKFERDGYVVLNNFLSEKEVKELKNAGEELAKNVPVDDKFVFAMSQKQQSAEDYFLESADKISYFYEKDALDQNGKLLVDASVSLNKVGHALHRFHPVFAARTYSDKVTAVCRALGLVKPVVPQSMYAYKNPNIGSEVVAHQDSTFLYTNPDSLIGFRIALDDATTENGCLWLIPRSHKTGLHTRLIRNPNKSAQGSRTIFQENLREYNEELFIPITVEKSSLVLLHGRVVHKTELNRTQFPRHAYIFHVFDEAVSQYCEQNWLQAKKGFKPLYE